MNLNIQCPCVVEGGYVLVDHLGRDTRTGGSVGKHAKLTDKQTGTETKKRTFTDVIKKGKLPRDLLNKGPVKQLK